MSSPTVLAPASTIRVNLTAVEAAHVAYSLRLGFSFLESWQAPTRDDLAHVEAQIARFRPMLDSIEWGEADHDVELIADADTLRSVGADLLQAGTADLSQRADRADGLAQIDAGRKCLAAAESADLQGEV